MQAITILNSSQTETRLVGNCCLTELCGQSSSEQAALANGGKYAINTDIASYFARLNHHTLENLLRSSGIPEGLVRVLVEAMLQTWTGRFSYGLPKGVFPSDLLGNFYLSTSDTFMAAEGVRSLRYVDDIVILYGDRRSADTAPAGICKFLRTIVLDFNESKTSISTASAVIHEQTEIDRLLNDAQEELFKRLLTEREPLYGFQDPWQMEIAERESAEESKEESPGPYPFDGLRAGAEVAPSLDSPAGQTKSAVTKPESTEGGRLVSILKWPEGAPLNLG